MITYRATIDVSLELARFVAGLLAAERLRRGTPKGGRALTCYWQAVLGLRWFRDRTDIAALARDHGVSRATGYRYVGEVIEALAAKAPELPEALARAMADGVPFVILDGKIIPADRCKEKTQSVKGKVIDLWYSGKAHHHGGNIQAVIRPDGFPLWVSAAEPGSVHDITVARIHALPALYRAASLGMPTLADPGYQGAGIGIHIPVKQPEDGRELDLGNRTRNALQRSARCLGETGLRWEEAAAVPIDNVDLENQCMVIDRTASESGGRRDVREDMKTRAAVRTAMIPDIAMPAVRRLVELGAPGRDKSGGSLYSRLINGDRGGYRGYATWRKYLKFAHGYTAAHKEGYSGDGVEVQGDYG